ncbi:hypothetical protein [Streptomyces xanthophaeus]|uniref:hypothetical protein n=1 Tax=Streptomyces xanthophaeus TaxID=67385 RepID=UPI003654BFA5
MTGFHRDPKACANLFRAVVTHPPCCVLFDEELGALLSGRVGELRQALEVHLAWRS